MRRLLVAAFVLETQHSHLFDRKAYPISLDDEMDLPFPSPLETWNCADVITWRNLITSQQVFSLSSFKSYFPPVDPFQSSLLTSYQIYRQRLSGGVDPRGLVFYPPKTHLYPAKLTYHALALCSLIPLNDLIITASDSWLFGTKITERSIWETAKRSLRQWIMTEDAQKAVWHATQLLRLAFRTPEYASGYLHDLWCLYVAALVCWAYGLGGTNSRSYPAEQSQPGDSDLTMEQAEDLARGYLVSTDFEDWREIGSAGVMERGNTRGLLECVRTRVGELEMGGLLDGAEDVLFRLVEGGKTRAVF